MHPHRRPGTGSRSWGVAARDCTSAATNRLGTQSQNAHHDATKLHRVSQTIPALTGLCVVAPLWVFAFHAGESMRNTTTQAPLWLDLVGRGGYLGVDIFFIIARIRSGTQLQRTWHSATLIAPCPLSLETACTHRLSYAFYMVHMLIIAAYYRAFRSNGPTEELGQFPDRLCGAVPVGSRRNVHLYLYRELARQRMNAMWPASISGRLTQSRATSD